ncbi:GntR family transcriptional regulator [Sphingomonas gellani]|uniref:GntR family transcriptional regulator n=1 Tax=Sphingomonas gellani TaxID=1166340 RepID=UPI001FCE2072|nr:GntR family transcriptional regulator [Sphingomonas gellani]
MQLQKVLRDAIAGDIVRSDEGIPTERDLAVHFDVSRITVRKALEGLVSEGLLARRRGAGTFVVGGRVEKSFSKLSSFSEDMELRGRTPSSIWVSRTAGAVTAEEALSLGLWPGSQVYRVNRIRYADGTSMAFEYSTVPGFCLASKNVVQESLDEVPGQAGFRPVRALQRLRAVAVTADQAQALSVEAGQPSLFIERRSFLADGRTVEFTQSYYRGDAYDLAADLSDLQRRLSSPDRGGGQPGGH